jgi:hypothetical protein
MLANELPTKIAAKLPVAPTLKFRKREKINGRIALTERVTELEIYTR